MVCPKKVQFKHEIIQSNYVLLIAFVSDFKSMTSSTEDKQMIYFKLQTLTLWRLAAFKDF